VKAAVDVDFNNWLSFLCQRQEVEFLEAVLQELSGIVPAVAAV